MCRDARDGARSALGIRQVAGIFVSDKMILDKTVKAAADAGCRLVFGDAPTCVEPFPSFPNHSEGLWGAPWVVKAVKAILAGATLKREQMVRIFAAGPRGWQAELARIRVHGIAASL